MRESFLTFKLKESFIDSYKLEKPNFGFNGLGELTYMRTYSRIKSDGTNECWWETVRRVVEGCYTIQKDHILSNQLGWSEYKAQKSAEEMFDRMFKMKFLPPGRGLWAMGTSLIHEKGVYEALNNCAFVSTENIGVDIDESTKPFRFLMDMSMVGVGVGFDVKGAGKITIQQPSTDPSTVYLFSIPDTREGWVDSVRILLESFFHKGRVLPTFDYSKIRAKGEPIKTFGGLASGPEPLMVLHERIISLFSNREGEKITQTDIVDIQNMIGCCVVAGNVRRTAEIVFGSPFDEEYLKLKDYRWNGSEMEGDNVRRVEWGWTSNNSVFGELGMNYNTVGKQTALNGEPGYGWLANMQKYGRMNDRPIDLEKLFIDKKAKGANPCNEQTLESFELCCLVETFPSLHKDIADYLRTLKFAYLYAKTVTLGKTSWVETNRVMLRNRRIGTSQSGIAQFIDSRGLEAYRTWCDEGYHTIQKYDELYSDWFCIPRSIKTTSVKPSGSVSLLPGLTPGMHYPESNYYIRRIRISKQSLLVEKCRAAGYLVEDDVVDNSSIVVEVPIEIQGVRTISQVSMWQQLSLAAFIQKWWADNQVSCTITFQPEEAREIPAALEYFQYQLKGVSFLPKTDVGVYQQMPYEEITEQIYKEKVRFIKPLDFSSFNEESVPEKYCDGDNCVI